MQRRCCCPPESRSAERCRSFLTSSQSPARASARSTVSASARRRGRREPCGPQRVGDVVEDRHRERVRTLEDHPDTAARSRPQRRRGDRRRPARCGRSRVPTASARRAGSARAEASSCRSPDGPTIAPTRPVGQLERDPVQDLALPVPNGEVVDGQSRTAAQPSALPRAPPRDESDGSVHEQHQDDQDESGTERRALVVRPRRLATA